MVGDSLVPVVVGGAVRVLTVPVEVALVAELLGGSLNHLVVILVVGIAQDGGSRSLSQIDLIDLTSIVQLIAHQHVIDHTNGDRVEARFLISVVVVGVLHQDLGVVLDVLGAQVSAVVPQSLVGDTLVALNTADLVQLALCQREQASAGSDGVEEGAGHGAGVHDGVVVRSSDADTVVQHVLVGQLLSFLRVHLHGVFVVISSLDDVAIGHRGVAVLVLGRVQHPLQTDQEILSLHVALDVAVHVAPLHVVAQLEGPLGSVGILAPLGSHIGHELAVDVVSDQTADAVAQHVQVGCVLALLDVPGGHLTQDDFPGDQVGDGLAAVARCSRSSAGAGSGGGAGVILAATGCQLRQQCRWP